METRKFSQRWQESKSQDYYLVNFFKTKPATILHRPFTRAAWAPMPQCAARTHRLDRNDQAMAGQSLSYGTTLPSQSRASASRSGSLFVNIICCYLNCRKIEKCKA